MRKARRARVKVDSRLHACYCSAVNLIEWCSSGGNLRQLAEASGVAYSTLWRWRTGRSRPTADLARRVSEASAGEISTDALLFAGDQSSP